MSARGGGRGRAIRAAALVGGAAAAVALLLPRPLVTQEPAAEPGAPAGKATYDKWCAGCHGVDGAGDGPGANRMLPRPRDFTQGLYEIRTTASGQLPTDADILAVIDDGMPGTAMPGWEERLSESQRRELVEVLKSFAPFFADEDAPEPLEIGSPPGGGEEAIAEGRELYERIECWKCHGQEGRGDGPSAPTLEDDQGLPVRAVDLTENWLFNGGGSTEAIFTRFMTGLNGTPMPSFADLIEAEVVTREQLWNLAHYVRSLAPEEPPVAREVIRAGLVEGALPAGVDDERWAEVDRFWIPLVGQIVVEPRWFAPRVDGVWVQALHDGEELALRIAWGDPSESPDPDWAEWRERVLDTMEPDAGAAGPPATAADTAGASAEAAPGATATAARAAAPGDTTAAAAAPEAGPSGGPVDALVVQFPTTLPEGMERPYFLLGSADDPVYLWRWTSRGDSVTEALGRGIDAVEPLGATGGPTAEATFDAGEWRLLVRRPLAAADVENRLGFETGRPIPIAFFAWDGDNGESGTRGAIGTWYFLWLDQPTEATVYAIPIAATLLTAALGVMLVTRARRRAGSNDHDTHQPEEEADA